MSRTSRTGRTGGESTTSTTTRIFPTSRQKITALLKLNLNIRRDIPITKATRIYTGKIIKGGKTKKKLESDVF